MSSNYPKLMRLKNDNSIVVLFLDNRVGIKVKNHHRGTYTWFAGECSTLFNSIDQWEPVYGYYEFEVNGMKITVDNPDPAKKMNDWLYHVANKSTLNNDRLGDATNEFIFRSHNIPCFKVFYFDKENMFRLRCGEYSKDNVTIDDVVNFAAAFGIILSKPAE